MPQPGPDTLAAGPAPLAPRLPARVWRMPPIETYPRLVNFAQTRAGRVAVICVFAALMKLIAPGMWINDRGMWLLMVVGAAIVSIAGRWRPLALLACTAVLLARAPDWFDFSAVQETIRQELPTLHVQTWYLRAAALIACVPLAILAIHLARRFRDHPVASRPILAQHAVYFFLIALATSHLVRGVAQVVLWAVIATFSAYFWYLAYAVSNQRQRQPEPLAFHLATFAPFYASTVVPVGKGAADWHRVEARSAEELAVTQLKAIKLLAWALVLKLITVWVFQKGIYATLGLPPLKLAFEHFIRDGELSSSLAAASVIVNFPERLLVVAVGGHVLVATARLAGFRLLRNTYRPLSSRTIAEFWNRYIYYFKEVLVQFYFYPTYLRWFKRHPRLRLAFATFMAAGVGNFIFHFMENYSIVKYGFLEALVRAQTYAFYCVLLSAGIIVSQLRTSKPDPNAGWLRRQFLPSLGVAAFFCFLSVFDGPQRHVTLAQHFAFLTHILGIGR
jgi:hypothetical protein